MLQNSAQAHRGSSKGAAVITVRASHCRSLFCSDVYAFATPFRIVPYTFNFARRTATLRIADMSAEEEEYVLERGVAVFLLPDGASGALRALLELAPLLSNTDMGEAMQIQFLKERMGASFRERSKPWVEDLGHGPALARPERLSFVASGDLLMSSKVRGPWGLFESVEKWVTGSWSGHMAIALRGPCALSAATGAGTGEQPHGRENMQSGTGSGGRLHREGGAVGGEDECLWVAESGRIAITGEPLIQVVSFEEWWGKVASDPCGPHVALLPLSAGVRERWNNSAAWELVSSVEGRPFGYHNLVFSWIDTPTDNFPEPLDAHSVAVLLSMWRHMAPGLANRVFEEALNKRLGTQGLGLEDVLVECLRRGITFGELLSVPEDDRWQYSDGISASCVGLAMRVWKAAGVFEALTDYVNAGEFTIRDAYQLRVFQGSASSLPAWCTRGRPVAFCQLSGKYEVDLPGYNSIAPYRHMNEGCPSMPPAYHRPQFC